MNHRTGQKGQPMPRHESQRCATCRFWESECNYCRCHAPTTDRFPKTCAYEWCGEWASDTEESQPRTSGDVHAEQFKNLGLLRKYIVLRADGTPTDPGAEYFILRLDGGGKDQRHIEACRVAVREYAKQIADHLPALSADLLAKYPPNQPSEQSIKLVWCPFCGGQAAFAYRGQPASSAHVACTQCGACGPETSVGISGSGIVVDTERFWAAARDAWNTRIHNRAIGEQPATQPCRQA